MKKLKMLCMAAALMAGYTTNAQENVKVSGFVQAGYTADDNENVNNTFYIKRARMSLSGNLLKEGEKKIDWKMQAEFSGDPKLIDFYVKYAFNDHIGIQLGQSKTPLSYENSEYNPVKLQMIDYSLVVQKLAMANKCTGRDLGVQLFGKFLPQDGYSMISYQAGLFNGNGILNEPIRIAHILLDEKNVNDDNQGKDFIGRIMVNPFKELTLSAYNLSRMGESKNPYNFARTGFGANYDTESLYGRVEYMSGYANGLQQTGAYALAGYKFNESLNAGIRYDYYTANVDGKAKSDHITAGVSYYPVKNLRLQANYIFKMETDATSKTTNTNGVSFLATIVY